MSVRLQPIYNIAELCAKKGIRNAVLCPGSRSAPLALAFSRHSQIRARTISDERSAAFMACGLSLLDHRPTALVCTSGSAAYQFAPAIAEAFLQQIPLLAFTADRPMEWIGQRDGQTIGQRSLYGPHVKASYELPADYSHPDARWYINRVVNEAINLATQSPPGPVHINVPLREPLYDDAFSFDADVRVIASRRTAMRWDAADRRTWIDALAGFERVLVAVGQHRPDAALTSVLERFSRQHRVPVIINITSNQHSLAEGIRRADLILSSDNLEKDALQPDLLITLGLSMLSKNVKQFLRAGRFAHHWHVQEHSVPAADTYQKLSQQINIDPATFFQGLAEDAEQQHAEGRQAYYQRWQAEEDRVAEAVHSFFAAPAHEEFHAVEAALHALPKSCNLHLANSLPVRYAAWIGLESTRGDVRVWANRGVSGIDGCSSMAVGHAWADRDHLTTLITGDMALFYDRNAFWHEYPLPNLRVIALNNHGGGIFSTLEGSARLPELVEHFVTRQRLTAQRTAEEFKLDYLRIDTLQDMGRIFDRFFIFDDKAKILEIETPAATVGAAIHRFKLHLQSQ